MKLYSSLKKSEYLFKKKIISWKSKIFFYHKIVKFNYKNMKLKFHKKCSYFLRNCFFFTGYLILTGPLCVTIYKTLWVFSYETKTISNKTHEITVDWPKMLVRFLFIRIGWLLVVVKHNIQLFVFKLFNMRVFHHR